MKNRLKFLAGILLIILNYPVGFIGVVLSGTVAVKTHNSVYYAYGAGLYGISWFMFGLGAFLSGPEGIRSFKQWISKTKSNLSKILKRD
ncbi:hypothetical protein GF337_06425 [candidate division KSB1 bacterium]|nr:hypothetical protein [candidate division KSB1 bacterium]